jgi:recombination DNA repair RAD52 pathway protein
MGHNELPEKTERLQEIIRKQKTQIENLKNENRKLKSQIKTLNGAWDKTEKFLENISEGKSLEQMIADADSSDGFKKKESNCRQCKSKDVGTLDYANFRIIVCNKCGHKAKI